MLFRKNILLVVILACSEAALMDGVAMAGEAQADGQSAVTEQSSEGLQEIVVTSERHRQSLQNAPSAITAISGDTIVERGLTDLKSVDLIQPSSRFSVESNVVQIFIRGVGTQIDSPFVPEPVATNFNDVYMPRFVTGTALYDIDRIEVLPGPQGTLYGKSALGGVVNINGKMPDNFFNADATLESGNYGLIHFTGVLNMPLSDVLAVRLAVNTVKRDGYFSNGLDTEDSKAARLSLSYKPSNEFSLLLWGSYYRNDDEPQPTAYVPSLDPRHPWSQPSRDPHSAGLYPPDGYDLSTAKGHYKSAVVGGKADWKLPGLTLTYVPSFVAYDFDQIQPLQGLPAPVEANVHQTTHELRLTGDAIGAFSWLGGLYWYHNDTYWQAYLGNFLGGYSVPNTAQGYAAYAQGTYVITNSLRATVGTRYSADKEHAPDAADIFPVGPPPNFTEGRLPFVGYGQWHHTDWKVGLEADVAPHSLLYGNVQSGYDPGGYQAVPPTAGQQLNSQTMIGYTIGSKNRFFDEHLQINDELYYYDYKNYVLTAQSGASSLSFNVPKSRIYGNELDTIYAFNSGTQFNVGVGLNSAEIRDFTVNGVSYEGYTLPFAPQVTVSAGAQQSFTLPNSATVVFRVDNHYENGYWGVFSHTSGLRQTAFNKTDVSLTYHSPDQHWDVSLWGRNLENRWTFGAPAETGYPPPYAGAAYGDPPRTFGVRLHYGFGHP